MKQTQDERDGGRIREIGQGPDNTKFPFNLVNILPMTRNNSVKSIKPQLGWKWTVHVSKREKCGTISEISRVSAGCWDIMKGLFKPQDVTRSTLHHQKERQFIRFKQMIEDI